MKTPPTSLPTGVVRKLLNWIATAPAQEVPDLLAWANSEAEQRRKSLPAPALPQVGDYIRKRSPWGHPGKLLGRVTRISADAKQVHYTSAKGSRTVSARKCVSATLEFPLRREEHETLLPPPWSPHHVIRIEPDVRYFPEPSGGLFDRMLRQTAQELEERVVYPENLRAVIEDHREPEAPHHLWERSVAPGAVRRGVPNGGLVIRTIMKRIRFNGVIAITTDGRFIQVPRSRSQWSDIPEDVALELLRDHPGEFTD